MLYRIDNILYDLLGSSKLIINWWHKPRPELNGETPMYVYLLEKDGPEIIMNYVKKVKKEREEKSQIDV